MAQLTPIPSPKISDIIRSLFVKKTDVKRFLETQSSPHYLFPKSCLALRMILETMQTNKVLHIYIPELFCEETLINMLPSNSKNIQIKVYPLNSDLSPDTTTLGNMIHSEIFSVVLLVHYFGYEMDFSKACETIRKSANTFIIEDCAHHLSPNHALGTWGDISIYSPHKQLPIAEGALLTINQSLLSREIHKEIETSYRNYNDSAKISDPTTWYIKRILQKYISVRKKPAKASEYTYLQNLKMSSFSQKILILFLKQKDEFMKEKNTQLQLYKTYIKTYFPEIDCQELNLAQPCPYHLTIYPKTRSAHQRVQSHPFFKFRYKWPDLPTFIEKDARFKIANLFYKDYYHIPLHNPLKAFNDQNQTM